MKTQRLYLKDKKISSIDRALLVKIGDSIYHNSEVRKVEIKIVFKDKTRLEYISSELNDEIERELINEQESGDEDG